MIIIVLVALAIATYWYFMGMDQTENDVAVISKEMVQSNENESQAIELPNNEILQDKCNEFARKDAVREDELKGYLDSCVEQLQAEATMVEPGFELKTQKEIEKQCSIYAKEDKVTKEKMDEYMDLCIEQLQAEDTMIEPELEAEPNSKPDPNSIQE
jgi:uncharacterized protein (UPF0371 family)